MDALDLAILREMTRDKVFWWGGRDPRFSTDAIARALKVAGSTVRARFRDWEDSGFLLCLDVLPNPSLLQAHLAGGSVRVDDPRRKRRVLEDLALVEGVVGALDHVGPWIGVGYAYEHEGALRRMQALVARLPGVDEATTCDPLGAVGCKAELTAVDWRIVQALRADPRATFQEGAAKAKVSKRTFQRRYQALSDAGALWLMPVLDFSRSPGGIVARVICHVAPDADMGAVLTALRGVLPDAINLSDPRRQFRNVQALDVLVHAPTLSRLEDGQAAALEVRGVVEAELVFPRRYHRFPAWFDERIAARIEALANPAGAAAAQLAAKLAAKRAA